MKSWENYRRLVFCKVSGLSKCHIHHPYIILNHMPGNLAAFQKVTPPWGTSRRPSGGVLLLGFQLLEVFWYGLPRFPAMAFWIPPSVPKTQQTKKRRAQEAQSNVHAIDISDIQGLGPWHVPCSLPWILWTLVCCWVGPTSRIRAALQPLHRGISQFPPRENSTDRACTATNGGPVWFCSAFKHLKGSRPVLFDRYDGMISTFIHCSLKEPGLYLWKCLAGITLIFLHSNKIIGQQCRTGLNFVLGCLRSEAAAARLWLWATISAQQSWAWKLWYGHWHATLTCSTHVASRRGCSKIRQ